MAQYSTIEVAKEDMKFSAAHFTIFSATERERLHGHNFRVYFAVTAPVGDDGLCFDYARLKRRVRKLCEALDEYTIIAADSPHLGVEEDGDLYQLTFANERIPLLKSDTLLLPIRNSTVEELARYLLEELRKDDAFVSGFDIRHALVKVSSGPGQWGSAEWHLEEHAP